MFFLRFARVLLLCSAAAGTAAAFTPTEGRVGAAATTARARVSVATGTPAAEVDERFLSFAIDTAQMVGGEFWAPRGAGQGLLQTRHLRPFDFADPRLRRMARALSPAYLRLGGTDADRTVYDLAGGRPRTAPLGARWVLTRERWDAMSAFARDVDARLMFTLNAGAAARDATGAWDPDNARALVRYARAHGDPVDVWELGNELNAFPLLHRIWLTERQYAHDLGRARALLDEEAPGARLAGPSSAFWPRLGEGRSFFRGALARAGRLVDVVTWHHYPQQSFRCPVATRRAAAGRMLPPAALADVDHWAGVVEEAARAHAPTAEVWLGETGGAQCGGEPASSNAYADALWWLDLLGRLGRRGQSVVVRQTLVGSDYGLIDEATGRPNPSYFASLLWRRLMGTRHLAAKVDDVAGGTAAGAGLRVYAACSPRGAPHHRPGAVTLLLVNVDPAQTLDLALPAAREAAVFRLAAADLRSREIELDGVAMTTGEDGTPTALPSSASRLGDASSIRLAPLSAAFVLLPSAGAPACL